jgi:shikimate dehydrogenase
MSDTRQLCMVIGHPIEHSLSPALHNAGYRELGIEDRFVYSAHDVRPENISDFVQEARSREIRGISCTTPHKEIIMPYLDVIDPIAQKIGAVNTVVQEKGKLYGYSTDWIGAVEPLKSLTTLRNKKVAVIGAGGAARAMVYGLVDEGAVVTVYNRTLKKAKELAREFNCQASALSNSASIATVDIICNATSLGMHPHEDKTPIDPALLSSHQIVLEAIYNPYETVLLRGAKVQGAQVIHGTEMLLYQAMAQFKLYTGQPAPEAAMREALSKGVKT